MWIYTMAAIAAVLFFSIVLAYVLDKKGILNINILMAMTLSSIFIIIGGLTYPFFLAIFLSFNVGTIYIVGLSLVIYAVFVFLIATFIGSFLANRGKSSFANIGEGLMNSLVRPVVEAVHNIRPSRGKAVAVLEEPAHESERAVVTETAPVEMGVGEPIEEASPAADLAYEEALHGEGAEEAAAGEGIEEAAAGAVVAEEDSLSGEAAAAQAVAEAEEELRDGVRALERIEETTAQSQAESTAGIVDGPAVADGPAKEMNITDYIDEAFRLKQANDNEGAVLNYMYALDKKPEDDLVFWIVLDLCVLYKEMGQVELAKGILESYVEVYGNIMDDAIKVEIEKNLL